MEEIGGEEGEDNVFEDNTGRGEESLSDMQVHFHHSTCTFICICICIWGENWKGRHNLYFSHVGLLTRFTQIFIPNILQVESDVSAEISVYDALSSGTCRLLYLSMIVLVTLPYEDWVKNVLENWECCQKWFNLNCCQTTGSPGWECWKTLVSTFS